MDNPSVTDRTEDENVGHLRHETLDTMKMNELPLNSTAMLHLTNVIHNKENQK